MIQRRFLWLTATILVVSSLTATSLYAQKPSKSLGGELGGTSGGGFSALPRLGSPSSLSSPYRFEATYEVEQAGQRGRLHVKAILEDGYYISSTTQPKSGPTPTFISSETAGVAITGPFTPDRDPKLAFDLEGFEGIRVEKFYNEVTWSAPITFSQQVTDGEQTIQLKIDGQVCRNACIPIIGEKAEAKFTGFYAVEKPSGAPYRDPLGHVTWTVQLNKSVVAPGEVAEIQITGTPDEGYHLYPVQVDDPEVEQRTLVALTQKGTLSVEQPTASSQPVTVELIQGSLSTTYHIGPVTWTIPLTVNPDKPEGVYPVSGVVGYQACTEDSCDQPLALRFTGELNVGAGASGDAKPQPLALTSVSYDVAKQAHQSGAWDTGVPARTYQTMAFIPLISYFALAVLGGLILNFMPCVLPVIGLKVMSFVGESGGDMRRSSALNLWYSAGLIAVFMLLAIATIFLQTIYGVTLGWGQQFQVFGLRVGIIVLLFAMALSFLGVWEIPIPGFATSGQSVDLSQKEGALGAFSKGVITTIVATPCSGPFLGAVFALSLTQPPWVILLMYLGVGLGMASPYLAIAAYPQTLRFLPKPGAWMETLKQVLAFPLLLSVVWFMTTVEADYRIAVLSLLVFVGFGCWLIGKVPMYAEIDSKVKAWGAAIAVSVLAGWFSFTYLGPREHLIDWKPYNETELKQIVASGQPVMIDFTASWCTTCQVNLIQAIETQEVADAIKTYNVVPMIADWSDRNEMIARKLQQLNSNSIPVLAIYPAGLNSAPIVLKDVLLKGMVVDALQQAAKEGINLQTNDGKTQPAKLTIPASDSDQPSISQAAIPAKKEMLSGSASLLREKETSLR